MNDGMNRKRLLLLAITTVLGGIGAALAATPFILSMKPSARARAQGGPVEVDFSELEDGQMLTVEWRGKPVWIMRRLPAMLDTLNKIADMLADPSSEVESQQPPYARNTYRSVKPEVLVTIGICTHLGCVPLPRLTAGAASGLGGDWPGGYCRCTNLR